MEAEAVPRVGDTIMIAFAQPSDSDNLVSSYTVMDVSGSEVSAHPQPGEWHSHVRAGTICLVEYEHDGHTLRLDALVASDGSNGVVVRLSSPEQRRFPRYPLSVMVTIILPFAETKTVADGTTEDISLDGLRAQFPFSVPVGSRIFVSIDVEGADPITAAATTLACDAVTGTDDHVIRAQFKLMSVEHHIRLLELFDRPTAQTGNGLAVSVPQY